jgi:hypothetical protein
MFYSNPTGCKIFLFLEEFLALHVSDVTCIHRQGTTVVYSHKCFMCGRWEILVSSCVEVYLLILCELKISGGIYVLVCVLAFVFVLRGFDVWSLRS